MLVFSILDCVPDHMGGSTGKLSAVGMVSICVEYIGLCT